MRFISFILIVLLLAGTCLAGDEFGLRLGLGTDTYGAAANSEFSAGIDFLVWQGLNMQLGATFLLNQNSRIDVAVNYLGLEYNLPVGKDRFFVGAGLNRSYIKGTSGSGVKETSFHGGYKMKWLNWVDLLLLAGIVPQKVLTSNPSAVSDYGTFFRTAVELYY